MVQSLYTFKLYALLSYGAFGLACLRLAGAGGRGLTAGLQRDRTASLLGVVALAFMAWLLLVTYLTRGGILLLDAAVIAGFVFFVTAGSQAGAKTLVAGISVGIIVLSLVWWRMKPSAGAPLPLAAFAAVLGLSAFAFADTARRSDRFVAMPFVLFAIAGIALTGNLGLFRASDGALFTLTHHWGAYIGPALHVRAGLVPFYDVPLQYGLGPTFAIASTCDGSDCWRGAHLVFAGTSLVNGLLVLAMALAASTRPGWVRQGAVTVAVFCGVFLWPGLPSDGFEFMATPSATGIRFLPVTLVAFLMFFDRPRAAAVAMIPALLWSPESAAMSVVVFGIATTTRCGFVRSAATTALLAFVSYGALFVVHRLVYGLWIDPLALLEYVLHVPGPLPIDPFSDVLLLATTLTLGGWLIYRGASDANIVRRDVVATVLLFAATSYYLGRSHPNNVCNLAPYLVLVATRALDRTDRGMESLHKTVGFGLAVAIAALVFSPWNASTFAMPPVIDIHEVVTGIPALQPDVERLRAAIPNADGLGIADLGPAKARHPAETMWWTPMDPSSLWTFVPSARRRIYIERSAARLRRSGWAIVADDQFAFVDDLAEAYSISNRRQAEGTHADSSAPATRYIIACFTPKPALAPVLVGPSCPAASAQRALSPSTEKPSQ